jgi:hypothetical protein
VSLARLHEETTRTPYGIDSVVNFSIDKYTLYKEMYNSALEDFYVSPFL